MTRVSFTLALLLTCAALGAACGSGSRSTAPATAAATSAGAAAWWEEPARFVAPDADRVTYISNVLAIAKSYGLTSPPDCASLFATPTTVDLTAERAMNGHARLDPLLSHADATTESFAGFDPCGTAVVVEGTAPDPAESYYAYFVNDADVAVSAALSNQGYATSTVGAAPVLSKGADDEITSEQYFSELDRVAVLPSWVITASASGPIDVALKAHDGASPVSNKDSVEHEMLVALGDFDAVALLGASTTDQAAIHRVQMMVPIELPSVWAELPLPDRVALAWKRTDGTDVLKFSLYYENADKAEANAAEFASRLRSYETLFDSSALCLDTTVTVSASGGIVIATCTTSDAVNLHGLVVMQDVGRLLSNRGS